MKTVFVIGIILLTNLVCASEKATLKPEHNRVFNLWAKSKGYRVAGLADNQNPGCKGNPSPYYVVGDFSGDKVEDFGVLAIDKSGKGTLIIFNGPFEAKKSANPILSQSIVDYPQGEIGVTEGGKYISFCVCETDNCGTWSWESEKYERQSSIDEGDQ